MTYCSVVAVLALVDLTKKHFDHYAILKILSLRSPRIQHLADISKKNNEKLLLLISFESHQVLLLICDCQ